MGLRDAGVERVLVVLLIWIALGVTFLGAALAQIFTYDAFLRIPAQYHDVWETWATSLFTGVMLALLMRVRQIVRRGGWLMAVVPLVVVAILLVMLSPDLTFSDKGVGTLLLTTSFVSITVVTGGGSKHFL